MARQSKLSLLHDAMMGILRALTGPESTGFEVDRVGMDVLNCFPIFMSYSTDTSKGKPMRCIRQGVRIGELA